MHKTMSAQPLLPRRFRTSFILFSAARQKQLKEQEAGAGIQKDSVRMTLYRRFNDLSNLLFAGCEQLKACWW